MQVVWRRRFAAVSATAAAIFLAAATLLFALADPPVNSLGMTLVTIAPGSFDMGVDSTPLPESLTKGVSGVTFDRPSNQGDYDEAPVHRVVITHAFRISAAEVTIDQFR